MARYSTKNNARSASIAHTLSAAARLVKSRGRNGGGPAPPTPGRTGRRRRRRTGRSVTRTRRKRKPAMAASEEHSGTSGQYQKIVVGKQRKQRKHERFGYINYSDNFAPSILGCGTGQQGAYIVNYDCHYGQLFNDISTGGGTPSRQTYLPGILGVNPWAKTSGSAAVGTRGTGTNGNNDSIFLNDVKTKYNFTNLTTAPITIDFYHYLVKDNTNVDPLARWGNVQVDEAQLLYNAARTQPGPSGGNTTAGYADQSQLNSKPHDYYFFRKDYKLMARKTFHMAAGANAEYSTRTIYNKLIARDYINRVNLSDGTTLLKGLTVATICIVKGSAIYDKNVAVNQMTTSIVEVGMVVERKVNFHLTNLSNRSRISWAAPNLIQGASLTDTSHVDVNDAIMNEAEVV